jgi:hypothetical protein
MAYYKCDKELQLEQLYDNVDPNIECLDNNTI